MSVKKVFISTVYIDGTSSGMWKDRAQVEIFPSDSNRSRDRVEL